MLVSSEKLSEILGLTDRRVRQLVEEGVLKDRGRGRAKRFALPESVQAWGDYREKSAIERVGATANPARADFDFERARKLKLENDTSEALLIPTPEAVAAFDAIFGEVRTSVSSIRAQATDDVALRRRIEDACDTILTDLVRRCEQVVANMEAGKDPIPADAADDA